MYNTEQDGKLIEIKYSLYSPKTGGNRYNNNFSKKPKIFKPKTKFELQEAINEYCSYIRILVLSTDRTSIDEAIINVRSFVKKYGEIGTWDVSEITDMSGLFQDKWEFGLRWDFRTRGSWVPNYNIDNWDVSEVTDMSYMFSGAQSFNTPLAKWSTKLSNVTNMEGMFQGALNFGFSFSDNQSPAGLSDWNVSNVTNMKRMFKNAVWFRDYIESWNVSEVTTMEEMFAGALLFNSRVNGWGES